uniref:Uncharacterized protein n=1 Tax=Rhizophora mucronata TaxID=61149 RepID=A0A2P2PWC7_RHIMU
MMSCGIAQNSRFLQLRMQYFVY